MKLMNITYEEALKMFSARRYYSMNSGFVQQLKLYDQAKYSVDEKSKLYTSWLSKMQEEQERTLKIHSNVKPYDISDSKMSLNFASLQMKRTGKILLFLEGASQILIMLI